MDGTWCEEVERCAIYEHSLVPSTVSICGDTLDTEKAHLHPKTGSCACKLK